MEGSPPATIRAVSSAQWSLVVTTTKAEEFELGLVTSKNHVLPRSAKWTSRYLGGSSWNRPQRPNPGHLRDCWGCLGRFLGRLGHRTTAIVSTRGVGKSLEFRPGAPGDFFQVDRNARE